MKLLLFTFIVTIIFVGCSPEFLSNQTDTTIIQPRDNNTNNNTYNQAIQNLNENSSDLNARYNYLNDQIAQISADKLDLATFTRVKIELDFLKISDYDTNKVNLLSDNFKIIFATAEANASTDSRSSLNDRYNSLKRGISNIQTPLKLSTYLEIEQGLDSLVADGYIPKRVVDLRTQLFNLVLSELESAIVNYHPPEISPLAEPPASEAATPQTTTKDLPLTPGTLVVNLIDGGFGKKSVKINVGDTIQWQNTRQGRYQIALIIGNRECRNIKSNIFKSGKSFNATFNEPMECWVSDGIFTTQAMLVTVS
jgi:plastocyanin